MTRNDRQLISDISTLTTIPKIQLKAIFDKIPLIISHEVLESIDAKESTCVIDVDFGKLYVRVTESEILYKFVPSLKLEKMVKNTVTNKNSGLTVEVEDTLRDRILTVYKDLF